jgi:hypothetical protein
MAIAPNANLSSELMRLLGSHLYSNFMAYDEDLPTEVREPSKQRRKELKANK